MSKHQKGSFVRCKHNFWNWQLISERCMTTTWCMILIDLVDIQVVIWLQCLPRRTPSSDGIYVATILLTKIFAHKTKTYTYPCSTYPHCGILTYQWYTPKDFIVKFVMIPQYFIQQQYLWNIVKQLAVGCFADKLIYVVRVRTAREKHNCETRLLSYIFIALTHRYRVLSFPFVEVGSRYLHTSNLMLGWSIC